MTTWTFSAGLADRGEDVYGLVGDTEVRLRNTSGDTHFGKHVRLSVKLSKSLGYFLYSYLHNGVILFVLYLSVILAGRVTLRPERCLYHRGALLTVTAVLLTNINIGSWFHNY